MGQIPIDVVDFRYLTAANGPDGETLHVRVHGEASESPITIKYLGFEPAAPAPRPSRRLLWDAVKSPRRWSRLRAQLGARALWSSLLVVLGLGAGVVVVALVKLLMAAWLVLLSALAIPAWLIGLVVDGK